MKSYLLLFILFFSLVSCRSKIKPLNKDLMVSEICTSFQNDDVAEPDSIKIIRIFNKHLQPYFKGIPQDSIEALTTFFYIRLQRDCVEFKDLVIQMNGKNSDWKSVDLEPESNITEAGYSAFIKLNNVKYLELNGDTVSVAITDSSWEDHFRDSTYSRLSLKKLNGNEFVLTFLESNNTIRKNLSHRGDQYRYKILQKNTGYYEMFAQPVGSKTKSLFKLYY